MAALEGENVWVLIKRRLLTGLATILLRNQHAASVYARQQYYTTHAQRVFFGSWRSHAGYSLDWRDIDPDQWVAANRSGATGDLTALNAIFAKVVSEARESE